MENSLVPAPSHCPSCGQSLVVTRLECPVCSTEVTGNFRLGSLAGLAEPYASLIDLFLRSRGNMKEMERELGLSYPTVRARLEEALVAAGYARGPQISQEELAQRRTDILEALERREITAQEAAARLRALKSRRTP